MIQKVKDKGKYDRVVELRLMGYSRNKISRELHLGHDYVQAVLEYEKLTAKDGFNAKDIKKLYKAKDKEEYGGLPPLEEGLHYTWQFEFHCKNSNSEIDHYFNVKGRKGMNQDNAMNIAFYYHNQFYPNHRVVYIDFVGVMVVSDKK